MAGSFANISGHSMILDTTVLDRITAECKPKAHNIVFRYGQLVASTAAQECPKDTTALEQSILAQSKMIEYMTFLVSDGVEYGIYQEFGTSKICLLYTSDAADE